MKKFKWQVRVYYQDTDAGGVVYHATYLDFYERARTEMLREMGIDQVDLLRQNSAFVVKWLTIDYKAPAYLDMELIIYTQVITVKKASLIVEQSMINQKNELINQTTMVIAYIDILKMKPMMLPKNIITELEK